MIGEVGKKGYKETSWEYRWTEKHYPASENLVDNVDIKACQPQTVTEQLEIKLGNEEG